MREKDQKRYDWWFRNLADYAASFDKGKGRRTCKRLILAIYIIKGERHLKPNGHVAENRYQLLIENDVYNGDAGSLTKEYEAAIWS